MIPPLFFFISLFLFLSLPRIRTFSHLAQEDYLLILERCGHDGDARKKVRETIKQLIFIKEKEKEKEKKEKKCLPLLYSSFLEQAPSSLIHKSPLHTASRRTQWRRAPLALAHRKS